MRKETAYYYAKCDEIMLVHRDRGNIYCTPERTKIDGKEMSNFLGLFRHKIHKRLWKIAKAKKWLIRLGPICFFLMASCGLDKVPAPTPTPTEPLPTEPFTDYCLGDCSGTAKERDARECFNRSESTVPYISDLARTNGLQETCTIVGFQMKAAYNGCAAGWRAVQYYCGAQ